MPAGYNTKISLFFTLEPQAPLFPMPERLVSIMLGNNQKEDIWHYLPMEKIMTETAPQLLPPDPGSTGWHLMQYPSGEYSQWLWLGSKKVWCHMIWERHWARSFEILPEKAAREGMRYVGVAPTASEVVAMMRKAAASGEG